MNIKLFAYGTLTDQTIQKALLGKELAATEAILANFRLYEASDGYYFVQREQGYRVKGVVLTVTEQQLKVIDLWEEVPVYIREKATINTTNGIEDVFIYTRPFITGVPVKEPKISALSEEDILKEIHLFKESLD